MKVKKNYVEYENWMTIKQLNKVGKTYIKKECCIEMWTNQFCNMSCLYVSPDNVRTMTYEELEKYKQEKREQRKKAAEKQKQKKEDLERREKYAKELRENWHTEWQWLRDYRRVVNDGAEWKVGKTLNEKIGRDWCVFGSDYCYFNIDDTTLITDENEYQHLVDESNKRYCGEK